MQSNKYNGKELDLMHGLNTYDYGARQYDPITVERDGTVSTAIFLPFRDNFYLHWTIISEIIFKFAA